MDVDLVDVDLDVDLVDVGLVDVVPAVFSFLGPRLYFGLLAPSCILGFWPPAVFWAFGPRLFYGLAVFRAVLYREGRNTGRGGPRLV